jgi:hypothetical protein
MQKTVSITIIILFFCWGCFAQQARFDMFINKFKIVNLPINNVLTIQTSDKDTLNAQQANSILLRKPTEPRPFWIDRDGNLTQVLKYYGRYTSGISEYVMAEKDGDKVYYFEKKILAVGKISLEQNYNSIIIGCITMESIYYDLWNLSKDGKPLSVICLYYGMKERKSDKTANYVIVNSQINQKGEIIWHENQRGLETFRTYKLNEDGYFQVIKEQQQGEFDY